MVLSNPKTVEYEVVRTTLLPGILKTVASNKKSPLPIKIFEVGDIVLQDASQDRRARNERRLCVLYSNKTSGFELIHGVLDRLMEMLGVPSLPLNAPQSGKASGYAIQPSAHATYFPGRQADILCGGRTIGAFGIVHPEVLEKFEISYPCSCLEINLEPFL